MASVIFHSYRQIKDKGTVKLFRSHNPNYKDGEQMRDFIYVKDVVKMCVWLMENTPSNGLYNIGSGQARTFKDLVAAIFSSLKITPSIEFVDTPEDIRDKYQYFTEADMKKIKTAGYNDEPYSLEAGIKEYLTGYLMNGSYF
jgi:ADP-L-glycero-D-manno-heptose 6-epimerase